MKLPLVSCIVVTYNSEQYIKSCLNALQKLKYKNVEIILVDNQSTDKTLQIAEKISPKIKIFVNQKNTGYAGGHSFGMSKSKGKYFFLLNPDTIVTPNFLEPLIDVMEKNQKVAAAQPLVYLAKDTQHINLSGKVPHYLGFDWLRDYQSTSVRPSGEILSFSGSGILLRNSAFKKVEGFDESYFMYYEDSDLSWRLRMSGFILWYCSESIIFHDYKFIPDEKEQSISKKLFWAERNRLYTVFKNYSLSTLVLILPMLLFMEFALLGFFLLKGWLGVKLRTYASLWNGRKELMKSRKNVQSLREVEDREVIANFESKIEFSLFNNPLVKYVLNPLLSIYWKLIWPLV